MSRNAQAAPIGAKVERDGALVDRATAAKRVAQIWHTTYQEKVQQEAQDVRQQLRDLLEDRGHRKSAAGMLQYCDGDCSFEELPKRVKKSFESISLLIRALGDAPTRLGTLLSTLPEEWFQHPKFFQSVVPVLAAFPNLGASFQKAFWSEEPLVNKLAHQIGPVSLLRAPSTLRNSSTWMLRAVRMWGEEAMLFAGEALLKDSTFAINVIRIGGAQMASHLSRSLLSDKAFVLKAVTPGTLDLLRLSPETLWVQTEDVDTEHAIFELECQHDASAQRYDLDFLDALRQKLGPQVDPYLPEALQDLVARVEDDL